MKVWVLGSGSSGNAVLLECDGSRVIVDAGFGVRTLARRLRSAGVDPQSVEGCVITHDHSDHVHGAAAAVRRWGWTLHATAGTARCTALAGVPVTTFTAGSTLRFSRMEVTSAAVPHDAAEPVGFVATSTASGLRAAICYDVGHVSDAVRALCTDIDVLVLEANHDEGMLWAGPYPPWLCRRIAGNEGHLSNRSATALLQDHATARLGQVVLAHLSAQNNSPETALRTVRGGLRKTAYRGGLTTAPQDAVVGPFSAKGARAAAALQFSLF